MLKRVLFLSALTGMAMMATADDASDKAAIKKLFADLDSAIGRKDVAAMKALVAPDCVWHEENGTKRSFAEVMKSAQMQMKAAKAVKQSTKITGITLKGNSASVKNTGYTMMVVYSAQQKKDMKLEVNSTTVDSVVKTAKGWRVKEVWVKATAMKINGQTFDPSKMQQPKR